MSTTVVAFPTPPAAPAQPPTMSLDKAIDRYVRIRDKIGEIKKKHTEELAPYNAALATLEGIMLTALNDNNAESMRTDAGTCYKSTHSSAKVVRWSEVLDFIRDNDAWELLEARVSKTAVEAIVAETGKPIPGVEIDREVRVNVRRPTTPKS